MQKIFVFPCVLKFFQDRAVFLQTSCNDSQWFFKYCTPGTPRPCPGYASCLFSPTTQQFVCCIPGIYINFFLKHVLDNDKSVYRSVASIQKYSCYPPHNNLEIFNGFPRQCSQPGSMCSTGYAYSFPNF